MANASLLVRIGANIQGLGKGLNSASKRIGKFSKRMKRVGALAGGAAVAGVGAFAVGMHKATRAAIAYDESLNAVRSALQRAGEKDVPGATDKIAAMADRMQFMSRQTDDAILSATALGSSLGIPTAKLEASTQAAIDLSQATGQSLTRSMELLGKSLVGKTSRLSNLVGEFDSARLESEGLDYVLEKINARMGGAGAQAVQTYEGRLEGVNKAWSNNLENAGAAITRNRTINAVLVVLAKNLRQSADWIANNQETIGRWVSGGIGFAIDGLNLFITGLEWGSKALNAFKVVGNLAIAGVIDVFTALMQTQADALRAFRKLAEWAGADKLASQIKFVEQSSQQMAASARETGDVFRSTAMEGVEGFKSTGRIADQLRSKLNQAGQEVMQLSGSIQVFSETAPKGLDPVKNKADEVADSTRKMGQELKKAGELGGGATNRIAGGLQDAALNAIKAGAAGQKSSKQVIAGLINETAALAVRSAMASLPFPANLAAAGGALVAAKGITAGLASFHEGGVVKRDDLTRYPGMAPNEGAVMVKAGERIQTEGQQGGGGNVTINIANTVPQNRAQLDRQVRDVIIPALLRNGFLPGQGALGLAAFGAGQMKK